MAFLNEQKTFLSSIPTLSTTWETSFTTTQYYTQWVYYYIKWTLDYHFNVMSMDFAVNLPHPQYPLFHFELQIGVTISNLFMMMLTRRLVMSFMNYSISWEIGIVKSIIVISLSEYNTFICLFYRQLLFVYFNWIKKFPRFTCGRFKTRILPIPFYP